LSKNGIVWPAELALTVEGIVQGIFRSRHDKQLDAWS